MRHIFIISFPEMELVCIGSRHFIKLGIRTKSHDVIAANSASQCHLWYKDTGREGGRDSELSLTLYVIKRTVYKKGKRVSCESQEGEEG